MVYDKSSYIVAIRNPELLSRHDLVTLYNLVIEANEDKIKSQLLIVQNPPPSGVGKGIFNIVETNTVRT